jgi:hypothetical protein
MTFSYRNEKAGPKIYMELQGSLSSQNNIEKDRERRYFLTLKLFIEL